MKSPLEIIEEYCVYLVNRYELDIKARNSLIELYIGSNIPDERVSDLYLEQKIPFAEIFEKEEIGNHNQIIEYFAKHGVETAKKRLSAFSDLAIFSIEYPTLSEIDSYLKDSEYFLGKNRHYLVERGVSDEKFEGPTCFNNIFEYCFYWPEKESNSLFGKLNTPPQIKEFRNLYIDYLVDSLGGDIFNIWSSIQEGCDHLISCLNSDNLTEELNELLPIFLEYEKQYPSSASLKVRGGFTDLLLLFARTGPEVGENFYSTFKSKIDKNNWFAKLRNGILDRQSLGSHYQYSLYFQMLNGDPSILHLDQEAYEIIRKEIPNRERRLFDLAKQPLKIEEDEDQKLTVKVKQDLVIEDTGKYDLVGKEIYFDGQFICSLTPSMLKLYQILLKNGPMNFQDAYRSVKKRTEKNDRRIKGIYSIDESEMTSEKVRANWFANSDAKILWRTLFNIYVEDDQEFIRLNFRSSPKIK